MSVLDDIIEARKKHPFDIRAFDLNEFLKNFISGVNEMRKKEERDKKISKKTQDMLNKKAWRD